MIWLVVFLLIVLGAIQSPDLYIAVFWPIYWSIGFYALYIKRTLQLKSIAYDDENIYVLENTQEVIIPFTNIREIKLQSVTGVHTIFLYRNFGLSKEIWFKSSLWYPFNFKKVDNEVYRLQQKIEEVKARSSQNPGLNLASQN